MFKPAIMNDWKENYWVSIWVKYSSLSIWQVQPKRCPMMSDKEGNDSVYIWENKDVCDIQTVKVCFEWLTELIMTQLYNTVLYLLSGH